MKQFKLVIERHRGPAEHHDSDNLMELWETTWWAFMGDPSTRADFWLGEKKLRGACMCRDKFFRGIDSMDCSTGPWVPGSIWEQHGAGRVTLEQIKDFVLSGYRSVAQDLKEEGKGEGFAKQLKEIEGVEKTLGRKSHYYRR